jgi:hypothetical protein
MLQVEVTVQAFTGATMTLKVSGRWETAGQSSISMMENRGLQGYEGEARERGESESFVAPTRQTILHI